MRILLLGSGGREHAIAWKLVQSQKCTGLFIAPGNAGTALCGKNVPIDISAWDALADFVIRESVDMVVAGPEEPLVRGVADYFAGQEALKHVLFVGPGAAGAKLEGSKDFAKAFMARNEIPTAAYRSFTRETFDEAVAFLKSLTPPYVIKADGLAAGKGVIIIESLTEAIEVLKEMLYDKKFGDASNTVVIEEFLEGVEMSVFVLTDGKGYCMLPAAKDYKRIGEGDTGANTGGMGAVSPVPFASSELMARIDKQVIVPTIEGLINENIPYCGFIFFGLMIVDGQPYVIEYNVRLGDPEAEAIIPRIDSDLTAMLEAACKGQISDCMPQISSRHAATVILASGGYPNAFDKGFAIKNLEQVKDSLVFYAGVEEKDNHLCTSGGRVMAITSLAENLEDALTLSLNNARQIDFKGKYFRRDIGKDLLH